MIIKRKKGISTAAIVILLAFMVAPSFAADKLSDHGISYWVRDSLRIDPRVDVAKVTVTSKRGIVTLFGSANILAAK